MALEMLCFRRDFTAFKHVVFISFFQVYFQRNYRDDAQWPCGYEYFQWTDLNLNNFWDSIVILLWSQVYSEGISLTVFALHKLYCTSLHQQQICINTHIRCLFIWIYLSPTSHNDFKLLQNDLLFLQVIWFFFPYPNQRRKPPTKAVSQVLCLERVQSFSSFSKL